jgi:hypothetical protein
MNVVKRNSLAANSETMLNEPENVLNPIFIWWIFDSPDEALNEINSKNDVK